MVGRVDEYSIRLNADSVFYRSTGFQCSITATSLTSGVFDYSAFSKQLNWFNHPIRVGYLSVHRLSRVRLILKNADSVRFNVLFIVG